MAPRNTQPTPAKGSPAKPRGQASPATPAERSAAEAGLDIVPPEDRIRIAEEASRQEDA